MSPDWDLIYRLMTSLYLTLFPGVLCFGNKTLQNVRIQQHYTLISEVFSNLSIAQANKNKQRRKLSHRGLYQTKMTRDAVAKHGDFRRSSAVRSGSDCASNSVSV